MSNAEAPLDLMASVWPLVSACLEISHDSADILKRIPPWHGSVSWWGLRSQAPSAAAYSSSSTRQLSPGHAPRVSFALRCRWDLVHVTEQFLGCIFPLHAGPAIGQATASNCSGRGPWEGYILTCRIRRFYCLLALHLRLNSGTQCLISDHSSRQRVVLPPNLWPPNQSHRRPRANEEVSVFHRQVIN